MRTEPNELSYFPHAVRMLRCRRTRRYFTGHGWSDDPADAASFLDEVDAARACVDHDLHKVELVLRTQFSGVELFSTPVR